MRDYKFPPQLLTRSPRHYRDWIRAAKSGDPPCSNFSVAGPFTEWILLGVPALRFEGKLEWDSAKMRVTNLPYSIGLSPEGLPRQDPVASGHGDPGSLLLCCRAHR